MNDEKKPQLNEFALAILQLERRAAALEDTERERNKAVADLITERNRLQAEIEHLKAELKTQEEISCDYLDVQIPRARAVAFEEAAQRMEVARLQVAEEFGILFEALPGLIRALAPLPASLVVVDRETVSKVRQAASSISMLLADARGTKGGLCSDEYVAQELAALRASLEMMSRYK